MNTKHEVFNGFRKIEADYNFYSNNEAPTYGNVGDYNKLQQEIYNLRSSCHLNHGLFAPATFTTNAGIGDPLRQLFLKSNEQLLELDIFDPSTRQYKFKTATGALVMTL